MTSVTTTITSCKIAGDGTMDLKYSAAYTYDDGTSQTLPGEQMVRSDIVAMLLAFVQKIVRQDQFENPASPTATTDDVGRLLAPCVAILGAPLPPAAPPRVLSPSPFTLATA